MVRTERFRFNAAPWNIVNVSAGGVSENQSNSTNFVKYLMGNSNFHEMGREELLENLYIVDPEIASAVDSFSVMCRESFKHFTRIEDTETDNLPDDLEELPNDLTTSMKNQIQSDALVHNKSTGDTLIEEMVDTANWIARSSHIENLFEQFGAILYIHGNLYILINKDYSITILPNDRVTIVDKSDKIGVTSGGTDGFDEVITEANILVLDEGKDTEKTYKKDKFRIIKFREVPINVKDAKNRLTYGIYSISPLRRAVIPVWFKRILIANDALWRAKNVPREHHKIDAESFNTGLFQGSNEQRMRKAQAAAENFINKYKGEISSKSPDQAYITLNTIDIEHVEPKTAGYMQANELMEQMNDAVYSAINLPRSVVKGISGSNFASELVISTYTSTKVIQIAKKIGDLILEIVKLKLLEINAAYPVQYLDIKIAYELGTSRLEKVKEVQILSTLGICTTDELRAIIGLKPLTPEQLKQGILNSTQPSNNDNVSDGDVDETIDYPTTPHSKDAQPTDSAQAIINKVEQSTSNSSVKRNIKKNKTTS